MKYFIKHPEKPKWYKYVIIAITTTIVLYMAFMGAYFVTSEPSFCTLCHEVKLYVISWRNSPHKNVKCMYCHEFRGFVGKLDSKIRGTNFVYQYFTGQYTVFYKGKVFDQNCAGCHLGDYYNYKTTPRLNMNHYKLLKEKRSCIDCHRETGHKTRLFSSEKFKK